MPGGSGSCKCCWECMPGGGRAPLHTCATQACRPAHICHSSLPPCCRLLCRVLLCSVHQWCSGAACVGGALMQCVSGAVQARAIALPCSHAEGSWSVRTQPTVWGTWSVRTQPAVWGSWSVRTQPTVWGSWSVCTPGCPKGPMPVGRPMPLTAPCP